jgi:photosystem II stability/assembly factor-like uncharacterized protein
VRRLAVLTAVLCTCFPASAVSSVFVGHSGWFWGNPAPQGNTLRAIAFVGERGYAVGDFGTVLRTDDGGTSWAGLTTGFTVPLRVVRVITPESIVVGGGCVVRRSDDGGASFKKLPWSASEDRCGSKIRSLHFASSDVGYLLLANGRVLRTQDGGRTWSVRTAVPDSKAAVPGSTLQVSDIWFTGLNTGFVVTGDGAIYRTGDGGTSWSPVAVAPQHLDSLYFTDPGTGYAAGGTSLMKTIDGGFTWSRQGAVLSPSSLASVSCADALRCVATTRDGHRLVRTADGGANWYSVSPATRALRAAGFTAAGHVVAVGDSGTSVVSYDGGLTFTAVGGDLGASFTTLRAGSPAIAYAFGKAGALARTSDGGRDWASLAPPSPGRLLDVSFPTADTGFALDAGGQLFRTDDAGASWRLLDTGTFLPLRGLAAVNERRVLLVGTRGIRRSVDGGSSFRRVRQPSVAVAHFEHAGVAGSLVFAYGVHVLALSPDGGFRWRVVQLPKPGESLVKVDFPTGRLGFALTSDGRVWKTRDRGRRWREILSIGTELGRDLAFSDVNHGYVAVREFGSDRAGYLMRTSDGGTSWRAQLVDPSRILTDGLAAPGDHTALAVSAAGHLLATDTGGDLGQRSDLRLTIHRERPGLPGVVTLNGRLTPADGGDTVVVSKRVIGSDRWDFREFTVAANGAFSVFVPVKRTTLFVAQWSGDDTRVGAGSRVLRVGVGAKYRQSLQQKSLSRP